MAQKPLTDILRTAGAGLFTDNSSYPKVRAQHALRGRTRYAEDSTLRYFKARILSSACTAGSAAFWLIESLPVDLHHPRRGFRFVCFDVFGEVIGRVDLDHAFTSSEAARKGFWAWFETFDLRAHYAKRLTSKADYLAAEAKDMRAAARALSKD